MNTTPNLGLKKPLQTEFYNVDDFNYNSDTIDQAIHDLSENKQNALSTSQMDAVNSGMTTAKRQKLDSLPTSTQLDGSLSSKANKSDITNISITGTTNNTGNTIQSSTLFYLNGTLCKTLANVANGATFTEGTNYVTITIANALPKVIVDNAEITSTTTMSMVHRFNYPSGWKIITISVLNRHSEPQEMFLAQADVNYPSLGNAQKVSADGITTGALSVTIITTLPSIDVWAKYDGSTDNPINSCCVLLQ